MSFYLGDEWQTMIQQGMMIQARRWRATKPSPNSVHCVCLRFGRTKIANETVNETVCWQSADAPDTGGRCPQQGLGTSGDLGNGDRVQQTLLQTGHRTRCVQSSEHLLQGTPPFGLFIYKVTIRVQELMKNRPKAKPLHLTSIVFGRKSKNGFCAFSRFS